ncbi:MAG: hypothetical protein P8008_08220, partial [Gammaproteobacteria bacterium]
MNQRFSYAAGLIGLGLLVGSAAGAGEKVLEKHVIAVRAGDSETIETDVTDLEPGEARSFVTDDGTAIDVLRGAEGLEIYIDGELVDHGGHGPETAGVHEQIEIECEGGPATDCDEELLFLAADSDAALDGADGTVEKRIEIVCGGDGACDERVWIGTDGELTELDALPDDGRTIRVIRIHEEIE